MEILSGPVKRTLISLLIPLYFCLTVSSSAAHGQAAFRTVLLPHANMHGQMCAHMGFAVFQKVPCNSLPLPGTALPWLPTLICKIPFSSLQGFSVWLGKWGTYFQLGGSDWSLRRCTLQVSHKKFSEQWKCVRLSLRTNLEYGKCMVSTDRCLFLPFPIMKQIWPFIQAKWLWAQILSPSGAVLLEELQSFPSFVRKTFSPLRNSTIYCHFVPLTFGAGATPLIMKVFSFVFWQPW